MKNCRKVMGLMLCLVLVALSGCAGGTSETLSASVTASSSPEASLSASPTPIPTPVPTTAPVVEPTPTATPDDGRVTVAEGFYYIELTEAIKERITGMSYPADDSDANIHYDDLRISAYAIMILKVIRTTMAS